MNDVYVMAVGGLLLITGLWVWFQSRRSEPQSGDQQELFAGVSIEPHAVLSEADLSLYNLIKLAVDDRYLVFAQLPVWSLVAVRTAEQSVRLRLLRKLAVRRVDFALVHPGTRTVQKVVLMEGRDDPPEQRRRRDQLIGTVLKVAGIGVVRLDSGQPYSVASLITALGLEPPDPDSGG